MEGALSPAGVSVKRILYATDFSRSSAAALPYALCMARQSGGTVIAVHVVSPGPLPADFPATHTCLRQQVPSRTGDHA